MLLLLLLLTVMRLTWQRRLNARLIQPLLRRNDIYVSNNSICTMTCVVFVLQIIQRNKIIWPTEQFI